VQLICAQAAHLLLAAAAYAVNAQPGRNCQQLPATEHGIFETDGLPCHSRGDPQEHGTVVEAVLYSMIDDAPEFSDNS